jgi:hypothetical protein
MPQTLVWILWSILTIMLMKGLKDTTFVIRRLKLKVLELEQRIVFQEDNVQKLAEHTQYPGPLPVTCTLEEVERCPSLTKS